MKNVRILDCTLRDGGRVIDCKFSDKETAEITKKLTTAGIDIVEVGFLRDWRNTNYSGNSTYFTDVNQIVSFLPSGVETEFVAFVDYGMFDFESLKEIDSRSISGIRVGFTKENYNSKLHDLVRCLKLIKDKGYKLFIQGVNSLNYSDIELLTVIEMVNEIKPASFGIVDTYGAMYVDDVTRLYNLIDNNLQKDVAIDFHSHNNFQLSFSFAQEVIKLSRGVRDVIIDATLNGMGKAAGNLNTELITDFLVRKMDYDYNLDVIFDAIDEHIYDLLQKHRWGYSTSALMSGIYKSHPNNVFYLTEKFRLSTNDIKNLLSQLDEQARQRYDYDRLDKIHQDYYDTKYNDSNELSALKTMFAGKPILVLAPGTTLNTHRLLIDEYIDQHDPVIISVNFISEYTNAYGFYANKKRYMRTEINDEIKTIATSNISKRKANEIIVDYYKLVNNGHKVFDNSTLMLLNLLKRLRVKEIAIAGMDGFSNNADNYFDPVLNVERLASRLNEINEGIVEVLTKHIAMISDVCSIRLLTPSIFENCFR